MRSVVLAFFSAGLLAASPALAQNPPANLSHPGAVALSQNQDGSWMYKSFPRLMPLYVFGGDEHLKSNCDHVCALVWPVIRAEANDTAVGEWTAIDRPDGTRQWAYKGRPVYMFYNDEPGQPRGAGLLEGWYYEPEADQLRRATEDDPANTVWHLLEP